MKRMWLAVVSLAMLGTGCFAPTRFYGMPTVQNGPAGCRAVCTKWGMELAGMVQMGEYTDGCICQVKPAAPQQGPQQSAQPPAPTTSAVVGAGAAVAAIAIQTQADEDAAASRQHQQHTSPGSSYQPWRPGNPFHR